MLQQSPLLNSIQAMQSCLKQIVNHPFHQALANATLSEQQFAFYLQQDRLYLRDFTAALSALEKRTQDQAAVFFRQQKTNTQNLEFALQTQSAEQEASLLGEPTLATLAYGLFVLEQCRHAHLASALAALFPCYWIYLEIAQRLDFTILPQHPYQNWIDTYRSDRFAALVRQLQEMFEAYLENAAPATLSQAMQIFARSCYLEWQFVEAVWRQQTIADIPSFGIVG